MFSAAVSIIQPGKITEVSPYDVTVVLTLYNEYQIKAST